MKKNKIAFTMIELIVVSLIMVLLWTTSVFYFFDFTDNRALIVESDVLKDRVEDLNKQIKSFQISDYNLYFTPETNYFTGSVNNLGATYKVLFNIDSTGTGSFSIESWSGNLLWNYSIWENQKEIINKITSSDESQQYYFDTQKYYSIQWYITDNSTQEVFSTNIILLEPLLSNDSGVILTTTSNDGVFSNKNNIITPTDLTFEKGSNSYILELK